MVGEARHEEAERSDLLRTVFDGVSETGEEAVGTQQSAISCRLRRRGRLGVLPLAEVSAEYRAGWRESRGAEMTLLNADG
jgi:hypothetical protein